MSRGKGGEKKKKMSQEKWYRSKGTGNSVECQGKTGNRGRKKEGPNVSRFMKKKRPGSRGRKGLPRNFEGCRGNKRIICGKKGV